MGRRCQDKLNKEVAKNDIEHYCIADLEEVTKTGPSKSQTIVLPDKELFGFLLLDSGSSSNVAGLQWRNDYFNNLTLNMKKTVLVQPSNNKRFWFKGGEVLTSMKIVTLPGKLSSKNIMLTSHIVDSKIPMLLSRTDTTNTGVVLHLTGEGAWIFAIWVKLKLTKARTPEKEER